MLLAQSVHSSVLTWLISVMHKLLDEHPHLALHVIDMLPAHKLRHHKIALWATLHHSGQAYFLHTKAILLSQKPSGVLLAKSTGYLCAIIDEVGARCGKVLE